MKKHKKNSPKKVLLFLGLVFVAGVVALILVVPKVIAAKASDAATPSIAQTDVPAVDADAPCQDVVNKDDTQKKTPRGNTTEKKPKTGNARLLELPATQKGEIIISHSAYTLSYNTQHNNPNWVAWELTAAETQGTGRRSNEFQPDPMVDARHRVTTDDYKGSGYDRGHMCPAADNKFDPRAMTECFYMSNMCPQLHELNAGSWESLESACRRWAQQEGGILIVCGPVYDKDLKSRQGEASTRKQQTIGSSHRITVPTGFFKCVVSLREGQEKAIAFLYTNNAAKQPMNQVCTSVDEIEALTGYDFFVNIPKKIEKRIEATYSLRDWK